MDRRLCVAILLFVLFPGEIYLQLSINQQNAVLEGFQNCTCLPENQCDDNEPSVDTSIYIERRMNVDVNRIPCQSGSSSIKLYCCKNPKPGSSTSSVRSPQIQNTALEILRNCKCVPENRCDENNYITTENDDPSVFIQRRSNVVASRIQCESDSSSVKMYCCKTPDQNSNSTNVRSPDTQNAILEIFQGCKCVSQELCDENNYIITDDSSANYIQRRAGAKAKRIPCQGKSPSDKLFCCKPMDSRANKPDVIEKRPEVIKCGTGTSSLEPRILTGSDEETPGDGEFPWMAAIFNRTLTGDYQFRCGGTLIHPKVVLTANHCVYRKRPSDFIVAANGGIELPGKADERRAISEIIKHPKYAHHGRLYNDAAMLILEKPFSTVGDKSINTLCLPPSGLDLKDLTCYVTGWGGGYNKKYEDTLKKVEVPFIARSQCQTLLRKTRLTQKFNLHESFLCAGTEEGKDACLGDGGSPLMCLIPSGEDQYFQAGIVSWGIGCGTENVPGVYTDVEQITEWIKTELRNRNLHI